MAHRLSALLVEDNPDDADVLQETLTEAHAQVALTTVETLRDAIVELSQHSFDVVLLDLSLPDSQGLATVERALNHTGGVPMLVLTGLEDEALGAAAVQAGAQDYLIKGRGDGLMLLRCMRYAIERHRLLEAQIEDAYIFESVARAEEALLSGGTGVALLERLCSIAITQLSCVSTAIWMRDSETDTFTLAAAAPTSMWHMIATHHVPASAFQPLAGSAERPDPVGWLSPAKRAACARLLPMDDDSEVLALILTRGTEIVGIQFCRYRHRPIPATTTQRIAQGFLHAATLALRNAQLVDELERSNTIKTYFAATMSHELRGTLFAIGGLGDMLLEHVAEGRSSDASRLAQAITDRSRTSLGMIQAALEMTRSEVRATNPEAGEIDINLLMEHLAAETHVPSGKEGLALEWSIATALPTVRTDAIKLEMVLKNLISNAIKFTEHGSVRVQVAPLEGGVRFVVADTGIGIPAADLPHLFEPFTQAHGDRSRRAGGVGLGLYIAGRLVDLLGGDIDVESRPGQGTTFTVTIPATVRPDH